MGNLRDRITFYTLEYDPPSFADRKPLPVVIQVSRFTMAPMYHTDRIVYRQQPFTRDAYFYHRWRATPGDLLSHFLSRDMRRSDLFRAVTTEHSAIIPDFYVQGAVDEFMEKDERGGWQAVVSVTVVLVAARPLERTDEGLFQKNYRASRPCAEQSPPAVARAMSEATAVVSRQIIEEIHTQLAGKPLPVPAGSDTSSKQEKDIGRGSNGPWGPPPAQIRTVSY
jgi:cholesterol transport system auxiliary component